MERFFRDLETAQRFGSGPLSGQVQKLADQLAVLVWTLLGSVARVGPRSPGAPRS